jgi:hypothetical protein
MIDIDKYEGHTEGPWNLTPEGHIVADDMTVVCNKYTKRIVETNHKDTQLIADAPLLLAEVKRLRKQLGAYMRFQLWVQEKHNEIHDSYEEIDEL